MHRHNKITTGTALLALAFTGVLFAQNGPPASAGQTIASLSDQLTALTAQVNALQSTVSTLQSTVTSLQTSVTKLQGNIVASDLAGTYAVTGIQNELSPVVLPSAGFSGRAASVGAYIFAGTVTLNADGTATLSVLQDGSYLIFNQTSLQSAYQHPPTVPVPFTWSYSNGVVSTSGISTQGLAFNVGAGGRVLTHASANHSDGTDVLIVLTRLQ